MNRLIKYTLIAFISFNVFGGALLGIFEYKEDRETKKAFETFYNKDVQVMGAYDKKSPSATNGYVIGGMVVFVVLVGSGAVYSIIKRERLKVSKK